MNVTNLWVERYRPRTLDEIVLSPNDRIFFESLAKNEEIPHLLYSGTAGSGKSSLAKLMIHDVLKCDYLYINASDENGIDTIRGKIVGFAQTKSFDGKIKVILLDECLEENTLVTVLRSGCEQQIAIKDVDEDNDLVKSFNFSNNRNEWRPFYKIDKGIQEIYEIEFENNEVIVCTADHKWYVKDKNSNIPIRKKLIDIINEGIAEILSPKALKIKKITKLNQPARVYDLSVDETHNFFVGKQQIMTSNCDSVSMEAMKALRNTIEEYSDTCRFQLTCNYLHKIIEPIRSRCQIVNLVPPIDGTLKRVTEILKKEQIVVPNEQKPLLLEHVRKNLPDLRRIINDLQMFSVTGTLDIKNNQAAGFAKELVSKILQKADVMKLRKETIEGEKYFSSDYRNLLKMMFEEIFNTDLPYNQKGDLLLVVSEAMSTDALVIDKEINFFSAVLKLSRNIS